MRLRAVVAAVLLTVACGGQSTREGAGATGGTGAGGSGGSGGSGEATSTGGSGAVGGTMPQHIECDLDGPYPTCVPSCESDAYEYAEPVCDNGDWVCSDDSTDLEACPEHSCRRDSGL